MMGTGGPGARSTTLCPQVLCIDCLLYCIYSKSGLISKGNKEMVSISIGDVQILISCGNERK